MSLFPSDLRFYIIILSFMLLIVFLYEMVLGGSNGGGIAMAFDSSWSIFLQIHHSLSIFCIIAGSAALSLRTKTLKWTPVLSYAVFSLMNTILLLVQTISVYMVLNLLETKYTPTPNCDVECYAGQIGEAKAESFIGLALSFIITVLLVLHLIKMLDLSQEELELEHQREAQEGERRFPWDAVVEPLPVYLGEGHDMEGGLPPPLYKIAEREEDLVKYQDVLRESAIMSRLQTVTVEPAEEDDTTSSPENTIIISEGTEEQPSISEEDLDAITPNPSPPTSPLSSTSSKNARGSGRGESGRRGSVLSSGEPAFISLSPHTSFFLGNTAVAAAVAVEEQKEVIVKDK